MNINKKRIWRLIILTAAAFLTVAWIAFFFLGEQIATFVNLYAGNMIMKALKGKIMDSKIFIYYRFKEAIILMFTFLCIPMFLIALKVLWRRFGWRHESQWIIYAAGLFAAVNLWLVVAAQTALFWGLMWTGGWQNISQFQFKNCLLRENKSPSKIILMGSSQTNAQINEDLINRELSPSVWSTELTFFGSKAFDLLLTFRYISKYSGYGTIVCYLSETYFYEGDYSTTSSIFFTPALLFDLAALDGFKAINLQDLVVGAAGYMLPLFRYRDVFARRILGDFIVNLQQNKFNAELEQDLEDRATRVAKGYKDGHASAFQKRALLLFLEECGRRQQKVFLLCGQVNPALARHMEPSLRKDMLTFLSSLPDRYPHVEVVCAEEMPRQNAEDYMDLTHVSPEMQVRFTQFLLEYLKKRFPPSASLDYGSRTVSQCSER
ncbi:MAG: hypothetical protein NTX75_04665 [Proteobacteria bacterium]|nr:hypothetical protein [Pseudomonadota bacterium]